MRTSGKVIVSVVGSALMALLLVSCGGREEIDVETAQGLREESLEEQVLQRTVSRPGGQGYEPGVVGGTWVTTLTNDPKTFNYVNAQDAETSSIIGATFDYLADYDVYTREWTPNLASFEVDIDEAADELRITFTLRDDLYWTLPGQSREEGVKVTSDDVVFWYDEIVAEPQFQMSGFAQQFVDMPDGSRGRITVEKVDDRSFTFVYPRIVANPTLSSNMVFGPRYLYEPALREGGIEAVQNLLSVDIDPRTIPSIGQYHIVEYSPGIRLVMQRNPNYWKTDENGTSYPYIEEVIYRIVPDRNTEFLLFQDGSKDAYSPRPEDLTPLLEEENPDYTVYNGGETLGASFFVANQNPENMDPLVYSWFVQTEFRQALSSLLNRERIANQVYRGLARPMEHLFAPPNPYFNEEITLEYTYDPDRATELLESIGIARDSEGVMRDSEGNAIEFDINIGAENNIGIDMANIFADELDSVGITANVRPIDWQQLVERLSVNYDWEVVLLGAWVWYWPTQGSNVWPSYGNNHLWHPLQETPATEWEARIDYLYNEGKFTIDTDRRQEIYDEFQRIILEQVPMFWTVQPLAFTAVRDKWANVYYDTLGGLDSTYLYLKESARSQ